MAMIYNSIPYFPTQVSFFEEVAMELIEARYEMKAEDRKSTRLNSSHAT